MRKLKAHAKGSARIVHTIPEETILNSFIIPIFIQLQLTLELSEVTVNKEQEVKQATSQLEQTRTAAACVSSAIET